MGHELDDAVLLLDYHTNSSWRKVDDYKHFSDEVQKYLNKLELAVQERPYGEMLHLPAAVSMSALR